MSSPEEQILNAIAIASDHYGLNRDNRSQAIDFLATVRAESAQSWRPALSLFVATNPEDANERQFGHEVRIFCLSVLAEFLDIRHVLAPTALKRTLANLHPRNLKGQLDPGDFAILKEQFLTYLKSEYLYGRAESSAPFIRNKFSQVLTLLFLATYESQWPDFFADMFALLNPPPDTNIPPLNVHIAVFFFKLVQEISAEVADQLLKNARTFSAERMARDGRVRDLVRERDAQELNAAVLAIVLDAKAKLDQVRAAGGTTHGEPAEEVVDLGVRAFASYVRESNVCTYSMRLDSSSHPAAAWIDINLTVTPETVPLLFSLISDPSFPVRLAAARALTKIVTKGLKVPSDKLKLIQVLSLGPVIDQLESQTATEVAALPGYSENLTNFREVLSHLSNALGLELVALCSSVSLRRHSSRLFN
jgi:exportin-T